MHLLSPPICPPLLHHRSPFCCFLRSLQFNPHSDSDSHKAPPTLSYLSSPPHPGLRPSAFHFPLLSFSASLRGVKGMMKIGGGGLGQRTPPSRLISSAVKHLRFNTRYTLTDPCSQKHTIHHGEFKLWLFNNTEHLHKFTYC